MSILGKAMSYGGALAQGIGQGAGDLGTGAGKGGSLIGNTLTGTAKDAGILGVGQYKASPVDVNQGAFQDPLSADRQNAYAQQLHMAQARQAPTMEAAQLGRTNTVQAANLGPASQMRAANLGPASQVGAANIDPAQQAQMRTYQQALVQQLQQQASGQGPSLAGAQLQQGRDAAINQAMALAASQHGMNTGAAQRQVAQQAAAATGAASQQAAQMRIQEQLAAQQSLGGVLSGAREQDIGLATNQAGLAQQAGLANQGASNQFALQLAAMQQQAGLANQDATNNFALQQAGFQQQAGLANQGALNQANLAQAQLTQDARQNNVNANLAQTGLNDAQSRFLIQGSQAQSDADRAAQMSYQQMLVNQNLGIGGINSGAYNDASKIRSGFVAGIGQSLGVMGTKTPAGAGAGAAGAGPAPF